MSETASLSSTSRFLLTFAAIVVVCAGIQAAATLLIPFMVSIFLAIITAPTVTRLQAVGVPTLVALAAVLLAMLLVGSGVILLAGASIVDFLQDMPLYQYRLETELHDLQVWLREKGWIESDEALGSYLDSKTAVAYFGQMLASLSNLFNQAILIFLTTMFIILEMSGFPAKVEAIGAADSKAYHSVQRIIADVRQYMLIKSGTSLLTAVLVVLLLWRIGVNYCLLWGLLAFLLNFIPNIGSIIAGVPVVLLAWIQLGIGSAVWTTIGYVAINFGIGYFLEPRVMGRGLGLSTLVVFVSLVFWGWLLGPIGMFLSVPLTMILKTALEAGETTKWIAVLIGPEVTGSEHIKQSAEETSEAVRDSAAPEGASEQTT
ncbi:MAG: membrane protein [Gemmatales bacterium]|nr:MAG: membrane protein [Gemmatales bacterium]